MKPAGPLSQRSLNLSLASGPAEPVRGERFNTFTHALALALSLAGGIDLLLRTAEGGDALKILGAAVFASVTVMLFAASVLYHGTTGPLKKAWERADHASIYLLIAGTSTPFSLAASTDGWQRLMFAAVWLLAAWGVVRELRSANVGAPSLTMYLAMGWLGVLASVPVAARHSFATLGWLVAGALCYSLGTAWYRNPKGRLHAHGVWHLFVLGGTACHFMAVALLLTSSTR